MVKNGQKNCEKRAKMREKTYKIDRKRGKKNRKQIDKNSTDLLIEFVHF